MCIRRIPWYDDTRPNSKLAHRMKVLATFTSQFKDISTSKGAIEGHFSGKTIWLLWEPEPMDIKPTTASLNRRLRIPMETMRRILFPQPDDNNGITIFEKCAGGMMRVKIAVSSRDLLLYIPPRWECMAFTVETGLRSCLEPPLSMVV